MSYRSKIAICTAIASTGALALGVNAASAHTVSRTVDRQTRSTALSVLPGHCQRRSISLREKSAGGFQMYGYQAFRLPNCVTPITDSMGYNGAIYQYGLMKLLIWTGSGPYGGYSICRNVRHQFPYATNSVTNKFVDYTKGPCGGGYYAAAMCTDYNTTVWTVVNGQLSYASDGSGVEDCQSAHTGWLWTNDWHYFA